MASFIRVTAPAAGIMALTSLALTRGATAFIASPAAGNAPATHLRAAAPAGAVPEAAGSQTGLLATCSALVVAAGAAGVRRGRGAAAARKAAEGKEISTENIPRPEDLLESPRYPKFLGTTSGYMSRATRERHAITWTSKEELSFNLPIGGTAIMNAGENLCYFRKKEQCICLGKQLRKMKIENYKIYRLAKDGTVTFMHPADGVFPEKVNKGRVQVNGRPHTVLQNPQPGALKWTKYHMKTYEADPLTTMFVKARLLAWEDQENLFPLPQPNGTAEKTEDWPETSKKMQEYLKSL